MSQTPANYRSLELSYRKPRPGAIRAASVDPNEVFTVSVRVRRRTDAPPLPDLADFGTGRRGEKSCRVQYRDAYQRGADIKRRLAGGSRRGWFQNRQYADHLA